MTREAVRGQHFQQSNSQKAERGDHLTRKRVCPWQWPRPSAREFAPLRGSELAQERLDFAPA